MSDLSPHEEAVLNESLDHEKLDVYQLALEFLAFMETVLESIPKKPNPMIDQLRRASSSIVLNIAEGAGRLGRPDKNRFYRIALGSATECAAGLDVLHVLKSVSFQDRMRGKIYVKRLVAMLVKLSKSLETGRR